MHTFIQREPDVGASPGCLTNIVCMFDVRDRIMFSCTCVCQCMCALLATVLCHLCACSHVTNQKWVLS